MIIFSGLGFITIPLFCITVLLINLVTSPLTGYRLGRAPLYTAFVAALAGAAVFAVGKYLNLQPGAVKEFGPSGHETRQYKRHTLYYVPMEYWGIIIPLLGGAIYVADVVNLI